MNRRLVSTVAGTIVIGSAIGIAVAQVKSVADANAPETDLVAQEMTSGEMINYLKEQGAPFIMETTDLPKDRKYEVHLKGASPEDSIKAVAEALNLSVKKKGNTYVLENPMRDQDFGVFIAPERSHLLPPGEHHLIPPGQEGSMFMFKGEGFEAFGESMGKLFDDPQFWKELEGKDEKDWTPEQKAKFEAKMKEFSKQMESFGENFKFEFDEGKMKVFAEKMEKMGKDFEFKFDEKHLKEMEEHAKSFKFDSKKMEEHAKRMEEHARKMEEKFGKDGEAFRVRIMDADRLLDSVTEAQWKLMKERGHLKISDLTPAQREMLGGLKGDHKDLNITISNNGKTLKIQGD